MNREDIIRMAREAGLAYGSDEKPLGSVTRFAALIAAADTWTDWAVAWAPLPKVPAHIKQILLEKSTWL